MGAFNSFTKANAAIQLLNAVENGDLKGVKKCLESVNADINCLVKHDDGWEVTPLMTASSVTIIVKLEALTPLIKTFRGIHDHVEILRYLAERGAELDKANDIGRTAVFLAALNGHVARVECLLLYGADKNKPDNKGTTPLCAAAFFGYLQVVQCLLLSGADIDKADNYGASPLLLAAAIGHLAVVRLLLQHGAEKNKAANDGDTPLYVAALAGHLPVIQYLVEEQEVDVEKATTVADGRYTPLHAAIEKGHIDVAVYLMEHGMADLNAMTTADQRPMDLARGNNAMVQAIINEEQRRRDLGLKRTASKSTVQTRSSKRTRR